MSWMQTMLFFHTLGPNPITLIQIPLMVTQTTTKIFCLGVDMRPLSRYGDCSIFLLGPVHSRTLPIKVTHPSFTVLLFLAPPLDRHVAATVLTDSLVLPLPRNNLTPWGLNSRVASTPSICLFAHSTGRDQREFSGPAFRTEALPLNCSTVPIY